MIIICSKNMIHTTHTATLKHTTTHNTIKVF